MRQLHGQPTAVDPVTILRERARRLARPQRVDDPHTQEVLVFRIDAEILAVQVAMLTGIAAYRGCTPVPGAPAVVRGVVNRRGVIHPLFDTASLLGLQAASEGDCNVLFVRSTPAVGLLVGAVDRIERMDPAALQPPPASSRTEAGVVRGVLPDCFAVLDIDALLSIPFRTEARTK